MPYCDPTTLLAYVDARLVGDLAGDTGVRLTPNQIESDPNVAAALSASAGEINSAVLVGNRYTVAQLQSLTGDDAAFLAQLNAWLSFGKLCSRRGRDPKERPEYGQALEVIEKIKNGHQLFNVPQGNSQTASENFMTATQFSTLGLIRDRDARFMFPVRREQQVVS